MREFFQYCTVSNINLKIQEDSLMKVFDIFTEG